jgi:uncharacterized protein YggE
MRTRFFIALAILALSAPLAGCASAALAQSATPAAQPAEGQTAAAEPVNRTITVNGSGKTYLTPDIAYVTIGVHTEGASASDAVAENNQLTQQVVDTIKKQGVDEKDIQTTNFSISPQQQYDTQGKPTGEIRYMVDNSVVVTIRDISKVGEILDTVVKAGANTISGIQFDVADKTAALSLAREAAVNSAHAKAEELAAAAGVNLGPVQTISEYSSDGPTPMYSMRAPAPMAADVASVPVSAGQMLITVEVNIVYGIQ